VSKGFKTLVKEYRNVIVLTLGTLTVTLGLAMASQALISYLIKVYGITMGGIGSGVLSTVLLIAELTIVPALLPIMGWISDKSGRKKMIVLAFFLYSFDVILVPTTIVLAPYSFYILISGFASSVYSPAYDALIADSVERHRRGTAFGTIAGILSSVALLGPIVATAILQGWNYSAVLYSSTVIILVGAVLCWLLLIEPSQAHADQETEEGISNSSRVAKSAERLEQPNDQNKTKNLELLPGLEKSTRWTVIISLIIISSLTSFMLNPMRLVLLQLTYLMPTSGILLWLSLLAVLSLVLGGILSDFLGRKRTILVVLEIGMALSLLASLILLFDQYSWSFIVLMSTATFVSDVSVPVVLTLVADTTPARQRGLTYGLVGLCVAIGQLIQNLSVNFFVSLSIGLNGLPVIFALTLAFTIVATILASAGVTEPEIAY
jgi:MFS family permease